MCLSRFLYVLVLSFLYLTSFSHCFTNDLASLKRNTTFSNPTNKYSKLNQPDFLQDRIHSEVLKRTTFELPNGWVGRVDKYLSLIPIQVASQYLQEFYGQVQDRVMEKWISQPPVNEFTIGWGHVQLHLSSPTGTIPWNFILAYLQKMVTETRLGFAGNFEVGDALHMTDQRG